MTTKEEALKMAEEANAAAAPTSPGPEWVQMSHPAVEGEPATATREAFEEVWAPRGWVLEAEAVPAPETLPRAKKEENPET